MSFFIGRFTTTSSVAFVLGFFPLVKVTPPGWGFCGDPWPNVSEMPNFFPKTVILVFLGFAVRPQSIPTPDSQTL